MLPDIICTFDLGAPTFPSRSRTFGMIIVAFSSKFFFSSLLLLFSIAFACKCFFTCFVEWMMGFNLFQPVEVLFQVFGCLSQVLHALPRFFTNDFHCWDSLHMLCFPSIWLIPALVSLACIITQSDLHSTSHHPSYLVNFTLPFSIYGLPLPGSLFPLHALRILGAQGLYLGFWKCVEVSLVWLQLRTV